MLQVRLVSKHFGGLKALEAIDLDVGSREIVGLIGPNGAGKTTLFNCIAGEVEPDSGSIMFEGTALTKLPAHRRAALGIGRTFQNVGMARSLTVNQNLLLAQHAHVNYSVVGGLLGTLTSRSEERTLNDTAQALMEVLGLQPFADEHLVDLPYGTLKTVELGCALAMNPTLLLLDEPSSGLSPIESRDLGRRLVAMREQLGITMLVIEHHVPLVTAVCDYVYVLNYGRVITHGQPREIQRHPDVIAAYLGDQSDTVVEVGRSNRRGRPLRVQEQPMPGLST